MPYEQKPGSGALFKNTRKNQPSHPDYNGDINIEGKVYALSAWIKKSQRTGTVFMSLSAKPKQPAGNRSGLPVEEPKKETSAPADTGVDNENQPPEDDDIPF